MRNYNEVSDSKRKIDTIRYNQGERLRGSNSMPVEEHAQF